MKKHSKYNLFFLVIGVIMFSAEALATQAQEAERHVSPHFGIVEAYYRPDDARDLGVGWERIIFEWAQFQPNNPREFNTDVVPEAWLVDARQNGREVIGILKNTPLWASGIKKLGAPPYGLDLPIDDPGNYWAAFVKRAVQYYGVTWGIHHWIIYNEPDIRPGEMPWYEFDGEVEDYYHMLKVAYLAAKSVNPNVVIHIAGMAWWTDVAYRRDPYLRRLFRLIVADPEARENNYFFDVVTVHVYFVTQNVWDVLMQTRYIMSLFGFQNKQLWIDETNASPTLDPSAGVVSPQFAVSLYQQSDFIVQVAALSLAANVERFGVYRLYDDHFVPGLTEPWGLVRADGTRRPAYKAYQTVIRYFDGVDRATRSYSGSSVLVTLEKMDETIYVMWARREADVQFFVQAYEPDETATQIGIYGGERSLDPETIFRVDGMWYTLKAHGAIADETGVIAVEGSPLILVVDGSPRHVWIDVEGKRWRLQ
jgi:hypothetical protein